MRFDELELNLAVYRVRQRLVTEGEQIGAGEWEHDRSLELCRMIAEELVNEPIKEHLQAWIRYRKSGKAGSDGERKYDIIAQLYENGSRMCFYYGRGLGHCSEDVDLDRIKPETQGGVYSLANCVLTCSHHNRQRGDRDFAKYINQE